MSVLCEGKHAGAWHKQWRGGYILPPLASYDSTALQMALGPSQPICVVCFANDEIF